MSPFPDTLDGCWEQYKLRLTGECCDFSNPELVVACAEGAKGALQQCLDRLDPEQKPPPEACFGNLLVRLDECAGLECENAPANTDSIQDACSQGALTVFNWCAEDASTAAPPEWPGETPAPITYGLEQSLVLTTGDPAITGLSVWMLPLGVGEDGPGAIRLEDPVTVMSFSRNSVWELKSDTLAWPIEGADRVLLLAAAEVNDAPVSVSFSIRRVHYRESDANRDGRVDLLDVAAGIRLGWDAERLRAIYKDMSE